MLPWRIRCQRGLQGGLCPGGGCRVSKMQWAKGAGCVGGEHRGDAVAPSGPRRCRGSERVAARARAQGRRKALLARAAGALRRGDPVRWRNPKGHLGERGAAAGPRVAGGEEREAFVGWGRGTSECDCPSSP